MPPRYVRLLSFCSCAIGWQAAFGQSPPQDIHPDVKAALLQQVSEETAGLGSKATISPAKIIELPKVDPRVRDMASKQAFIPLFIILRNQPQREIVARFESATKLHREVAEARYQRIASQILPREPELRAAHEEIDKVIVQARRESDREIRALISSDLDVMEKKLLRLGARAVRRYTIITMLSVDAPSSALMKSRPIRWWRTSAYLVTISFEFCIACPLLEPMRFGTGVTEVPANRLLFLTRALIVDIPRSAGV